MTGLVFATPKLQRLWIAMDIQKAKLILIVTAYSKLHPKGNREWEGEKRSKINCFG